MAARAPILLLPLLLKHEHFVGPVGFNDGGFNRGVRQWSASLDVPAILHHQNVAKLNLRSRFAFEFFQSKCLSWCNPVLFAARTYHGVHGYIPFRIDKRLFYGASSPIVNDGFIAADQDRFLLSGKNDGSLGHILVAPWTARASAQDIFRGFGIATCEFVENTVEGNFRTVAALVATADHALGCSSQIFTYKMDRHFFQWRIKVTVAFRALNRVYFAPESDPSIFGHDTETGRAF